MSTITIEFNKDVRWDNCQGQYVIAFKKGDIVEADQGRQITSAESPYWKGISDIIYPEDFEVI